MQAPPPLDPLKHRLRAGFTLVEMSIVLVIIGLLVGAVLAGREMIAAAENRRVVSQIEGLDVAVNTFRGKYNGLPGDLVPKQAAQFGFPYRTGGTSHGDGNGVLDVFPGWGWASDIGQYGEVQGFWYDLAAARLIADPINPSYDTYNQPVCPGTNTMANGMQCYPRCKIGAQNCLVKIFTVDSTKKTYYYMAGMNAIYSFEYIGGNSAFTPAQAYALDSKLDDGQPLTGRVMLTLNGISWQAASTLDNTCASCCATSSTTYNFDSNYGSTQICAPQIKTGF